MRNRLWTSRGRPGGRHYSYEDMRLLEFLARISTKYGIDSDEFFDSFLDASQHQESKCGKLSIEYRMKTRGHTIFLITSGSKVVAQFPMPEHVLMENNPIKEFMRTIEPVKNSVREAKSDHLQIKDLRVGMKGVNIKGRVLEVSQPRFVATRFGFSASVTNVLITDGTGTIQLPLWNRETDEVSAGDFIQVGKANVIVFRQVHQLKVGRNGKVDIIKNG